MSPCKAAVIYICVPPSVVILLLVCAACLGSTYPVCAGEQSEALPAGTGGTEKQDHGKNGTNIKKPGRTVK